MISQRRRRLRSRIVVQIVEAIRCAETLENGQFVRHLLTMALLAVEDNATFPEFPTMEPEESDDARTDASTAFGSQKESPATGG